MTEAANRSQELFSSGRLREVVDHCGPSDPSSIVTEVVDAVDRFAEGTPQSDDIAMVCVQYLGVPWEISETFRRDINELPKIFDLIGHFFDARPIDPAAKNAVELAAEEIFTNYIRHNEAGKDEIEIRLRLEGNELAMSLTDFGAPPFDIEHDAPEPDLTKPLAERQPGGLGVFLVKTMMDRVEYRHDEGNSTVTLFKRVN